MDLLKYKSARHFLDETGLTTEQGLQIVSAELERLRQGNRG